MAGSRDRDRNARPSTFKGLSAELHAEQSSAKHLAVQHGEGVCDNCGGRQAKGINVQYKKGRVTCVNGPGCRGRQRRAARRDESDDG